MPEHDADKIGASPADRRTNTRDPNATSGPVVESGEMRDGLRVTHAGSTHLTTNIEGKWYVCDTRGEPFKGDDGKEGEFGPFDTESEAVAVAQKYNGQPDRKYLDGDADTKSSKSAKSKK